MNCIECKNEASIKTKMKISSEGKFRYQDYFACNKCMREIFKKWGHYPNISFIFEDLKSINTQPQESPHTPKDPKSHEEK